VRQFPNGAIACSTHSSGQLDWQGPFNYVIHQGALAAIPGLIICWAADSSVSYYAPVPLEVLLSAFGFGRSSEFGLWSLR
jgi:hypothetical protein